MQTWLREGKPRFNICSIVTVCTKYAMRRCSLYNEVNSSTHAFPRHIILNLGQIPCALCKPNAVNVQSLSLWCFCQYLMSPHSALSTSEDIAAHSVVLVPHCRWDSILPSLSSLQRMESTGKVLAMCDLILSMFKDEPGIRGGP